MLKLFKSSKVAPAPLSPRLEIHVYDSTNPIWAGFAIKVEPKPKPKPKNATNGNSNTNEYNEYNEYAIDYTIPGELANNLSQLCDRTGAVELDAEKIMHFSEVTNYLLLLKKNGETIGFLMLNLYPGLSEPKIWLGCVSSLESGKQYSKLLIDQAKQMAIDAGKSTIHLEALTRELGRKVYMQQGFEFNSPHGENMTAQLSKPTKTRKNRKSNRRKRTRR